MGVGIDPGVVQVAVKGGEAAAGAVVKVFPVRVENRVVIVVVTAGHLVQLSFARVIDHDGGVQVVEVLGKSHPAAVPGPGKAHARQGVMIVPQLPGNLGGFLFFQIVEVDAHGLVHEHDFLAVGRPGGAVAEARAQAGQNFFGAGAVGRPHGQLIFPGAIAEIGDGFAVGRPDRVAFRHAGTAREIPNDTVLRRDGEQLAAGREHDPFG